MWHTYHDYLYTICQKGKYASYFLRSCLYMLQCSHFILVAPMQQFLFSLIFGWICQMLSRMIESSSIVFHNVKTTTSSYMELEAYRKAVNNCKVKDFSVYTHEARLVKSPAELKLMRDSASIACQVMVVLFLIAHGKSSLSYRDG